MGGLTVRLEARPRHLFAPGAFDRVVGTSVRVDPGASALAGTANAVAMRVAAVEIVEDGAAALLALEPIADEPQVQ